MICPSCQSSYDEKEYHHSRDKENRICHLVHSKSGKVEATIVGEKFSLQPQITATKENWLRKEFMALQEQMLKIMLAKNSDYSNGTRPFSNFEQIELLSGNQITREEATLVRMSDKMSRAFRLLKQEPKVLGEKLEDTLIDLANYSLLLIIMLKDRTDVSYSSK